MYGMYLIVISHFTNLNKKTKVLSLRLYICRIKKISYSFFTELSYLCCEK